jgi:hypothetical protein
VVATGEASILDHGSKDVAPANFIYMPNLAAKIKGSTSGKT